jgi:GTP-binding protein
LNAIAGRGGLARVGRTPGRTQRIHFFSCRTPRGKFALVDLPGYGFACAPREAQERWGAAVERYLFERENLRALALLCDVRRDPQEEERQVEGLAEERGLRLVRIATKLDKLSRAEAARRLRSLGAGWIGFSARTGEGRERVVAALLRAAAGGEG